MKTKYRVTGMFLVLAVVLLGIIAPQANADFMKNTDFSNDIAWSLDNSKDVDAWSGTIPKTGDIINGTAIGNVDTAAGNATIKPISDGNIKGTLTYLSLEPVGADLFENFSFRGQLDLAGDIIVKVTDKVTDADAQTFTFNIDQANADFGRIGIIAKPGTGETISKIEIYFPEGSTNYFREFKQASFSYVGGVNVPEPASMLLLGLGLVGLAGLRRKFKG